MTPLDEARRLLQETTTRIAVVGASNDRRKYGNIILNDLLQQGYDVVPVNPDETTIAGLTVYPTLAEVPKPVDIVDVVTQPEVTLQILEDAAAAGLALVWLQPGSFDDQVLEASEDAPFQTVHDACIMVEAHRLASKRS